MTPVYISIGSNVDRERNIRSSVTAMREQFGDIRVSKVYECEAVGFEGDHFYNLAAAFETGKPVEEVDRILTQLEDEHGRDRSGPRFSPRTLDLDLLLFGDYVSDRPGLELPRSEITEYAFVLSPLAELAPDMKHPTLGQPIAELWNSFDQASQPLWPVNFDWKADD